jgi:YbbR domain-containing protein
VVTVYSTDPEAINKLPGYIETQPLNLANASEDIEVNLPLNLPSGVIVVGDSTVKVSISISPIRGSRTFINLPVEVIGLLPENEAQLSPDRVDVIFSGPLPTLEKLRASDIRVQIDLKDAESGVFQEEPQIEMTIQGLMVESILPGSIEVTLAPKTSP